jgi:hypothetical protein
MSATNTAPARENTVSLANEEAVKKVLVDSVLGLWDVVNNLTRLQPSTKPNAPQKRWPRWAATSLPAVVQD